SCGVPDALFLSLGTRADVLGRHQASVVSEHLQLAAEMMRPDASLHADKTRRQVGQSCFHLPARPFLPKHDCTTFIVPHHVKRVLADIDTDHGDCRIELMWHGVLLVFGAPFQLPLLAGPEHGPTLPLADIQRPDPNPAPSSVHKSATMPCSVWARRRGRPRYSILARVGKTLTTCRSRTDSVKSVEGRRCSKLRTGSKGSVSGNTLSALPRMIL